MNIFESLYLRNNVRTMSFLGQWPFQSPILQIIIRFFVLLAIWSIFIPKLIKLYEVINDIDGIIECIPMVGLHTVSVTKYCNWMINSRKMKCLLLHMQQDWDDFKLDEDKKIVHKICKRGRFIAMAYSTIMFSILGMYLASPAVPRILDMAFPLNRTRGRIYLYQTEYFVDPDEYYLPILIHAYMTVPVSVSVIVFIDNMFAAYIHHACGMLTMLKSHLEKIHVTTQYTVNKELKSTLIREEIVLCAKMHKNVIKFVKELESSGAMMYLVVLSVNLSMVTVTGIVTVMKLNQPSEAIKFIAFTIGEVFHIFFSSFQGQVLIDHSEEVYTAVYLSEWYGFPPRLQKLLIPIMMESSKPCQVTAGKLYAISMGTFSIIMKNAMSFFTVLSSMR